jgi:acylglycerol lipase
MQRLTSMSIVSFLLASCLAGNMPSFAECAKPGDSADAVPSDSESNSGRKFSADLKPQQPDPDKRKGVRKGNAPCLAWTDPQVPPYAVILCVHGLGLHNGTYEAFGKEMCKRGIAIYAIDVRGFGSWVKANGREKVDFDGCLEDVRTTLKVIRKYNKGLPVFILGESMGGAIALRVADLYPNLIDGLISSVPAGDRFQQKKTSLKVALHLLAGPNKPFNIGSQIVGQATDKQELRDAWCNDPLTKLNLSPVELIQFQSFMNENHASAKRICSTPVLLVQGCKDKLVRPEGTVELYNELATPDRKLELISSAEHLIFEEGQFNEQVLDLVETWVKGHLKGSIKNESVNP